MFGAERLLGTLVSTGLGGIGRQPTFGPGDQGAPSGSAFTRASSGGLGGMASIALLGTLAYKAYQSFQQQAPQPSQARQPSQPLQPPSQPAAAAPEATVNPSDAQTLIRAMIAAANADGHVDASEESRIHRVLENSGASEEDRRFVAGELQSPASVDVLARAATNPDMASHIYAASLLGIADHTAANQAYLRYLASRLNLDGGVVTALHNQIGAPPLS
jgi:uncharacterized membrane protein YebE (DUF533 family)